MMEAFQVGRASVREALRILEVQGLITIRPGNGGGPRVAAARAEGFGNVVALHLQFERATFQELGDARCMVEPILAAEAAVHRDDRVLELLDEVIDRTDTAATALDRIWWTTVFHEVIHDASHNRVMSLLSKGLLHVWAQKISGSHLPIDLDAVETDHRDITEAIRSGDAKAAEQLMRLHMERYSGNLHESSPAASHEIVHLL
jgi:DNA-binding FadR family transcriptional regulator